VHSDTHTREQFVKLSVDLGLGLVFSAFVKAILSLLCSRSWIGSTIGYCHITQKTGCGLFFVRFFINYFQTLWIFAAERRKKAKAQHSCRTGNLETAVAM